MTRVRNAGAQIPIAGSTAGLAGAVQEDRLVDVKHPLVQRTATELTIDASTDREKLERIFVFVRDGIKFGFPPEGDFVAASATIERNYGQCNTKGIAFLALCQAAGLGARLHFSRISKEIQRGFFTGLFYRLMPAEISHSWMEIELDGNWHRIDTYINDLALHDAAVRELDRKGWITGYSVSRADGEPGAELCLGEDRFSQMGAVIGDHGIWTRPSEFLDSAEYLNRPSALKTWLYRLYLPIVNRRVRLLRSHPSRISS